MGYLTKFPNGSIFDHIQFVNAVVKNLIPTQSSIFNEHFTIFCTYNDVCRNLYASDIYMTFI